MIRSSHTSTTTRLCALAGILLIAAGCVSRELYVHSTPSGATVRINGEPVGRTPLTVPYKHYGVYSIELRKEGFAPLRVTESLLAPWYARFPVCVFSELLLPVHITDGRFRTYVLRAPVAPERAALLKRANGGD